jgi:hypothetical protein
VAAVRVGGEERAPEVGPLPGAHVRWGVAATHLRNFGVSWDIIGHSEVEKTAMSGSVATNASLNCVRKADGCADGVIGIVGIFSNSNAREGERVTCGGAIIMRGPSAPGWFWSLRLLFSFLLASALRFRGIAVVSSVVAPAEVVGIVVVVAVNLVGLLFRCTEHQEGEWISVCNKCT